MEHSKYYYDYDRNDPNREDPFVTQGAQPVDLPGSPGVDQIEFNVQANSPYNDGYTQEFYRKELDKVVLENKNGFWKYDEDVILKEIKDYLGGTYRAHYAGDEGKTQTLDLIDSIGDAEAFCRSNAIKYLSRFGKKNGKSKLDILKAIHYCILLTHFSGVLEQPKDNYETF